MVRFQFRSVRITIFRRCTSPFRSPLIFQNLNVMSKIHKEAAEQFIQFVDRSPSPFHAVKECQKLLGAQNFIELDEKCPWEIKTGGKYFITKNQSSIIAFAVGGAYSPGNGFSIVGAHTDSPCLKVKPVSKIEKHGYLQVGVECYGGGIWNTWFDRDLTVAGRVIIKKEGKLQHKLVNIKKPILRVPHLAIHLQRDINDKFSPNLENHTVPVLATQAAKQLLCSNEEQKDEQTNSHRHQPLLIQMLCEEMSCECGDIVDFELCLADTQPATLGGAMSEFIFSPRLDNLVNAYASIQGLIGSLDSSFSTDTNIRMAVLYDNEEIGSRSAQGAFSNWTELVLRRLSSPSSDDLTCYERSLASSFLVSADQAHACHPNYSKKHESNLKPALHQGPVIKYNANQKYATTAVTASVLRIVAEKHDIPLQEFAVRNDSPCGSTIGPILSAKLGISTVDIGGPQLSMHSIREMCCTSSIHQCTELYKNFYIDFPEIQKSLVGI
ncbi:aspartyl aminopeptidase-like isoform X2 [Dendronephthya gigantea]|uniref:aspartyl aminopeptidase-like isoform X2 n=1 Tax=Dendronephthya gigantea TaxID=151771 RepID=UPI00106A87A2|nr:aspartyl aminopeptidase-like isoform X2 [Dendronephthya gigantea]